jgi:hypothetical protein
MPGRIRKINDPARKGFGVLLSGKFYFSVHVPPIAGSGSADINRCV